jgi:hypothetical protein
VSGDHAERQVRFGANSVALVTLLGCALCHAPSTGVSRSTVSCKTPTQRDKILRKRQEDVTRRTWCRPRDE